ncbi:MAG: ABC transporter permease [Deltaproteobacteria bacterium]|nr:ABC transporter permease [Deltaproteobacteria bacterium]
MPVFRHAWRNLWRNSRRTMITLAAVMFTTAILIASYSLMQGMIVHAVQNATNLVMGEVQVHAPDYRFRRELHQLIDRPETIMDRIKARGVHAAARTYGYGLAACGSKSSGAMFWGVNPKDEISAFDLCRFLETGKYLDQTPMRGVVLGKKLAKSLKARVGSEIVVVVQAADGSMGNDLYTVTGILKSAGDSIDRDAAIIHRSDFAELFVLPEGAHEIAVNSRGGKTLEETVQLAITAAPGMETASWRVLVPALSDITAIFDAAMVIFGLVFILAGGLGVMNTMLMATFERTREFGILKALGATRLRIVGDVAAEALVLASIAASVGMVIGLTLSWYLTVKGIDTSAFSDGYSLSGIAVDTHWRAKITLKTTLFPVVSMSLISVLASLYPAWLAARLDPVKAINAV